jgi:4-amino-4-deoxy-L-arabinose transferase-like glycosyltransferase/Flp pilus assembly protein TadD
LARGFWVSPWSSVLVFLVAVTLRGMHLSQMERWAHFKVPVLDAAFFDAWGQRIAAGDWFGSGVFFVDPLYPYFLGGIYKVFGHNLDAVRVIQMLLGGLSAVLIQRLGIRLLGGAAGFLCGLLAACYRPFIYYDALLLKSALKVPLTTLFLFFSVGVLERARRREALLAGVFLGLAILSRGNLLLMAPVALLAFLFSGNLKGPDRAVAAILLVAGLTLVIAPVAWRNHRAGGEWVLTTSGLGQNLYIGNHPGNNTGAYVGAPFTRPNPDYEENDFKAEAEKRTGRRLTSGQVSRYWTDQTLAVVAANPWRWIVLEGKKFWLMTHAVEIPDNYSFDFESRYSWVLRLPFPGFAIIFPLGLAGIIAAWRERRKPGLKFLAGFTVIYFASLLPFFITSRFRIPAVPALIVLAVAGLIALGTTLRRRQWGSFALLLAVVIAVGVYTRRSPGWIPVAEIHFNFGTELQAKGHLKDAEEQFREALKIDPGFAEAYNNLGAVLASQGRADEAAAMFRKAAGLKPGYWEADYNRADSALRAGRTAEAAAILEKLAAERPDSYEANLLLGMARKRTGRSGEALEFYRKAGGLKPEAIEAPYNEAILLKEMGRIAEARTLLERLAREHPEHQPTRQLLEGLPKP